MQNDDLFMGGVISQNVVADVSRLKTVAELKRHCQLNFQFLNWALKFQAIILS